MTLDDDFFFLLFLGSKTCMLFLLALSVVCCLCVVLLLHCSAVHVAHLWFAQMSQVMSQVKVNMPCSFQHA